MRPQKGWSPKAGTRAVGRPACSPMAVVPAPPWCTTALHRGNSHECGTCDRTAFQLDASARV